jgi:hypothetical protein
MNPTTFFALGMRMARLGLDSQIVVAERMARFARGDADSGMEVMRMVTEKALALAEAQAKIVSATAAGHPERAAQQIVALYGRKVRANRRRLKA